jgi:hypothetical protein
VHADPVHPAGSKLKFPIGVVISGPTVQSGSPLGSALIGVCSGSKLRSFCVLPTVAPPVCNRTGKLTVVPGAPLLVPPAITTSARTAPALKTAIDAANTMPRRQL